MSHIDFALSQRTTGADNSIVILDAPASWRLSRITCSVVGADARLEVTIAGGQVTTLHIVPGPPTTLEYGSGGDDSNDARGLPCKRGTLTVVKMTLEQDNPPPGYVFDLNAFGVVSSYESRRAVEAAVSYSGGAGGESGSRFG